MTTVLRIRKILKDYLPRESIKREHAAIQSHTSATSEDVNEAHGKGYNGERKNLYHTNDDNSRKREGREGQYKK